MQTYKIGEFSKIVKLTPRTIRYYQEKGIFAPITKENQYRYFTERDIHVADYVKQCRLLGISLDEISDVAKAYRSDCNKVDHLVALKKIIDTHICDIEKKEDALRTTKEKLMNLKEKFEQKIERYDHHGDTNLTKN